MFHLGKEIIKKLKMLLNTDSLGIAVTFQCARVDTHTPSGGSHPVKNFHLRGLDQELYTTWGNCLLWPP